MGNVGPLAQCGLNEAFGFAIGTGHVRTSEAVTDAEFKTGSAELTGAIAGTVVGEQAANGDAVLSIEGDGGTQKSDSGLALLIGEHAGEGEAGVIVDGHVQGLPAGKLGAATATAVPANGDLLIASHAFDIEMEEVAGSGMFVAHHRRRGMQMTPAIELRALQNAADGGGAEAGDLSNLVSGPQLATERDHLSADRRRSFTRAMEWPRCDPSRRCTHGSSPPATVDRRSVCCYNPSFPDVQSVNSRGTKKMHRSGTRAIVISALILAVACFAIPSALAQTALKAQIPAAPAGGLDPSKLPDIEGIHLGMTPDEVIAKLKALGAAPANIQITTVQYLNAPNPKWIAYVFALIGAGNGDTIKAAFSAPPNKQVLVHLERQNVFKPGTEPTADTIKAALFQKYGANPVPVSPTIWVWTYNEQEGPLVPAPPARQIFSCGTTVIAPNHSIKAYTANTLPLQQQELTQWMNQRCNSLGVYVNATFYGSSLSVTMTDTAEDLRDALAGELYLEKLDASQQQNLQKDTQKNVPKL
jgi:hypothetical protein